MKNLFLILLIPLLIVGCTSIDEEYDNNESFYESIQNETLNEITNNTISFQKFKQITNQGFENIKIDNNYCYEFEFYDSTYDECVVEVECDTDEQCAEFDVIYEDFLYYLENINYIDDTKTHVHHSEIDPDLENEYLINENDELELLKGEDYQESQDIWNIFSNLVPKEYRTDITHFGIFTDGVDNTLAYVSLYDAYSENWYVAIDYEDYYEVDLKEFHLTLVHEYAHILSLNSRQVDYYKLDSCLTLELSEGCLENNSYLNDFYVEFWKNGLQDEHLILVDQYGEDDAAYELYSNHEGEFITDYAATNVVEDFAESFSYFILTSQNSEIATHKKIQHFYNNEELVELRAQMRSNLDKGSRERR